VIKRETLEYVERHAPEIESENVSGNALAREVMRAFGHLSSVSSGNIAMSLFAEARLEKAIAAYKASL
jgi:hypothetical protein